MAKERFKITRTKTHRQNKLEIDATDINDMTAFMRCDTSII